MTVDCIWALGATLGEGPLWDAAAARLRFVDIRGGRIHACDVAGGMRETCEVGGTPSFIQPLAGGGFVVGNGHALQRFDGARITGEIARLAMPARNRFNDATVDPRGRLWFGSMDDDEASPVGAVHVHDGRDIAVAGGHSVITNGPAITSDARWLYHVDTPNRTIWRFDIAGGARLDRGERFVTIEPDGGHPDGVTIDAEDHLWVGLWGGWGTRRYAPDGTLVQTVALPCANVTKLAFGGPDLRTAFATTARDGLDAEALGRQPLAGGLFAFRVDVPGVAAVAARIPA